MSVYFFKEMEKVKNEILALGAMVEGQLHKAVLAMTERDATLAKEIIAKDEGIDAKEVEIEEELLKIIALHQPVAHDLRFLVATLKINNDMERLGDLAVNIAERAMLLSEKAEHRIPVDLVRMSDIAETMVRQSIDALVKFDTEIAASVCTTDDTIDELHDTFEALITKELASESDPDAIEVLLGIQHVCRDLERIGDHATNIAEDVIYMCEGRIIRHHIREYVEKHVTDT